MRSTVFALLALTLLAGGRCAAAGDAPAPNYDRDVRPILSDRCYQCHGPDAETRAAELRLDTAEGLLDWVVVPGDIESSELVRRVASDDSDERMPPAESGLSLTAAEIDTLRRWVEAGAEVTGHWAFEPLPESVPVPAVDDASWPTGPLDRFVLARLQQHELRPTPPAAPLRLLRRVSLDLTGLPPTVDEIRQFEAQLANDGIDAVLAAAVDRLLASPAYGEHMAVAWLDAVRYADSYGFQSDQLNSQWPYRDWVVRALNDNLPYDEFLTWQLAGDLLPDATRNQILATAMNRLHRMTNEGGSLSAEWLVENAADRVDTFGTAILGLTLGCARCHDHKYDPISARDYYSMMAFFNSIDENGLYDRADKVPAPSLLLPTDEQAAQLAAAEQARDDAADHLQETIATGEERFAQWLASQPRIDALPGLTGRFTFDDDPAHPTNSAVDDAPPGEGPGITACEGVTGQAVALDGDSGLEFPELFEVDRSDPWSLDFHLRDTVGEAQPVVVAHRTFGTDVGYNGTDVMLAGGRLSVRIYRVWPGNGIGVQTAEVIPADQWRHVCITYDGSSRARGIRVYVDGREVETTVLRDHVFKSVAVRAHGNGRFALGARFRDRGFRGGQIDELRVFDRALAPLEAAELHAPGTLTERRADHSDASAREQLRQFYFAAIDPPAQAARQELTQRRAAVIAIQEQLQETAVMRELPAPRPTHVLARGAYDAPRTDENRVERTAFEKIMPPLPAGAPRNRLGLAQWLTTDDHPLTARVLVNRVWANFFGAGLVTTPENFGSQGARPTHPELLDWLARDFVAHGWDIKRLCRQIALSATYRQDSRASNELRQRDPTNALLARGPSFRLSAEQLRDQALAVAGLLNRTAGGSPVSPYQPGEDLWRESNVMSPPYKQSVGEALYRRSLYSVWKRTAPLPNMLALDAPTREVCTVSRSRTNTPLQALVLLNDVQFVEAARALAERVLPARGDDGEMAAALAKAFLTVTGRPATPREQQLLQALYAEQRAVFADAAPDAVAGFLAAGDSTLAAQATPELAALTVACQAILNLDAAIMRR
ncbi:MAG: hypothetical protein CMJ58_27830 [Planctomycetaceae bacterium]|nr:hypothetical protein [Planctomycetaceae bacterium]